jgi:hypothetical protein
MSMDDLPDPDEPFQFDPSELEAIRYVIATPGRHAFCGCPIADRWNLSMGTNHRNGTILNGHDHQS